MAVSSAASAETPRYEAPAGSVTEHVYTQPGDTKPRKYTARAEWMVLRQAEKPAAEMFHIAYMLDKKDKAKRPVTFICNGGPGAASAYLHLGAIGPERVVFNSDGSIPPPPCQLANNDESWLAFSDLVFIDPIGTGFSRPIETEGLKKEGQAAPSSDGASAQKPKSEYYQLNRDLQSLCEFIQQFLSTHGRWMSPVFIAGESYGGFRVAKLVRLLQERYGVGLSGAILISPALEWYTLVSSDYDILHWVGTFPTMVAAAHFHGKCRAVPHKSPLDKALRAAEHFAFHKLAPWLTAGDALPNAERAKIASEMADFLGLPVHELLVRNGRLPIEVFARLLLKDKQHFLGLYDATVSTFDVFPDRPAYQGPDPSLSSIDRVFTSGINAHLRDTLKLKTERAYHLLNMEVNAAWKVDAERHVFDSLIGATDDLRYGMALNPYTKICVTHGYHDMVTPYYASNRILAQLKLEPRQLRNLTVQHFGGGHMFYTWEASRKAFRDSMQRFYTERTTRE